MCDLSLFDVLFTGFPPSIKINMGSTCELSVVEEPLTGSDGYKI